MSMQFDAQDIAALQALDDTFTFNSEAKTAKIAGEMEVTVTRPVDDQFLLTIVFPGGGEFVVRLLREPSLQSWTSEAGD